MKREQVGFKTEADRTTRPEALSGATRRTKTSAAEEATSPHPTQNEWQLKSIEAGLEDAKAGRVIESEALLKKWERRFEDSPD